WPRLEAPGELGAVVPLGGELEAQGTQRFAAGVELFQLVEGACEGARIARETRAGQGAAQAQHERCAGRRCEGRAHEPRGGKEGALRGILGDVGEEALERRVVERREQRERDALGGSEPGLVGGEHALERRRVSMLERAERERAAG